MVVAAGGGVPLRNSPRTHGDCGLDWQIHGMDQFTMALLAIERVVDDTQPRLE